MHTLLTFIHDKAILFPERPKVGVKFDRLKEERKGQLSLAWLLRFNQTFPPGRSGDVSTVTS